MAFYNMRNDASNFTIGFTTSPHRDFSVFANGYGSIAISASRTLMETTFSDNHAYPLMFLFRHALECHLKHIIYTTAELASLETISELHLKLENTHNLEALIELVVPALQSTFPSDTIPTQIIHRIHETCLQFADIDPASFTYRYPIDPRGGKSGPSHQTVNLASVTDHMETLFRDFEAIDFGLAVDMTNAQEIIEAFSAFLSSY